MIKAIFKKYSASKRLARGRLFLETMDIKEGDKILDIGGGTGEHLKAILPDGKFDVYVADISSKDLEVARSLGFKTIQVDESGRIPFEDNYFDVIFCNSVIEHVTVDKEEAWNMTSKSEFETRAFKRQMKFAEEIRRVSKKYFVQTPHKYFILESHTWFINIYPFISRRMQIKILRFFQKYWVKKTSPDWNLLTASQMSRLFPDAKLIYEKSLGLTKSFIAVRTNYRSNVVAG
jgi:SAM-dependent methyltransferase